jgi:hypothetical protein
MPAWSASVHGGRAIQFRPVFVIVATLAPATIALLPSHASASGDERNAYVVAKGGPYFPTQSDALGTLYLEWSTRYAVDLGVGAYWEDFGLQLSAGYLTTRSNDLELRGFPILMTGRVRLPLGIVGPYLQAGVGVAFATASFDKIDPDAHSGTAVSFEAVAGFGADVYLGPLILGAELKYLWLKPHFVVTTGPEGSQEGYSADLQMSGITMQAYVGYRW